MLIKADVFFYEGKWQVLFIHRDVLAGVADVERIGPMPFNVSDSAIAHLRTLSGTAKTQPRED